MKIKYHPDTKEYEINGKWFDNIEEAEEYLDKLKEHVVELEVWAEPAPIDF
jgi:hypothetical protein